MAFVQIMQTTTSQIDEVTKIGDEWEAAVGDASTVKRRVLCQDRDNPNRYFNIVFFDSYESAMANSDHPATQQFAAKMSAALDEPPTFYNLDVLDDRS